MSCAPECDNARTAVGIALQLARGHDDQAIALAANATLIRDVVWHQVRMAYAMSLRRGAAEDQALAIGFDHQDFSTPYIAHLYLANAILADPAILDGISDELTTCAAYPLGSFLISAAAQLAPADPCALLERMAADTSGAALSALLGPIIRALP